MADPTATAPTKPADPEYSGSLGDVNARIDGLIDKDGSGLQIVLTMDDLIAKAGLKKDDITRTFRDFEGDISNDRSRGCRHHSMDFPVDDQGGSFVRIVRHTAYFERWHKGKPIPKGCTDKGTMPPLPDGYKLAPQSAAKTETAPEQPTEVKEVTAPAPVAESQEVAPKDIGSMTAEELEAATAPEATPPAAQE